MLPAHHRALAAIKAGPGKYPVGVTLAMADEQAVGDGDSKRDEKRERCTARGWTRRRRATSSASRRTRGRASAKTATCRRTPAPSSRRWATSSGPKRSSRRFATRPARAKVPVYVTENGIGTEDDTRRVEYIKRALAGVQKCLADGIDVRGYIHWSLLDNFEWMFGYRPKFGLVERQPRDVRAHGRSRARACWATSRNGTARRPERLSAKTSLNERTG